MDLAAKDSFIQKLASKVFCQQEQEPKKRPFVHLKGKNDVGPPKKKKKCKKKHFKERGCDEKNTPLTHQEKFVPYPAVQKNPATTNPSASQAKSMNGGAAHSARGGSAAKFSAVNVLHKRLKEKIEESRGQGPPKDALDDAVQAKRAKRKLERERKKRKRKEFKMKKLAEEQGQGTQAEVKQEAQSTPAASKRNETAIVFNKMETVDDGYKDKMQRKKEKRKSLKGQLTPLTGKNYKQLLSRVEARKQKVEQLREKDEGKARDMENKMKWTNLLYKAEGIKIKDNEDMLRTALKKKEKRCTQRKKHWTQRSEHVIGKMQRRQDKRRKNIQKRQQTKTEKKKDKARKKGRILPEDLKKAAV